MPWARLDDHFPGHPKVVGLSDRAFRVHVTGICYAAEYLTDGWIPAAAARAWSQKAVRELVAAGLWQAEQERYFIHDYTDYNPPKDKVLARREAERQRRQSDDSVDADAQQRDVSVRARLRQPDVSRTQTHSKPLPVPVPDPSPETLAPGARANGHGPPNPERTALKDSLVELSGWSPEHMTKSSWGRVERAAKEANQGGYSPSDLALAARLGRQRYRGVDVTPQAIVGWLPSVPKWLSEGRG